jgi:hypothetical protein
VNKPLEHRLALALAALAAAEKNARDATKNPVYWKTQIEREQKLIEALEAELREAELREAEPREAEAEPREVDNPVNPAS